MSWGGLEEYSGAIVAFDRAISLNSNFANVYYNRGYVYQQLNCGDLAIAEKLYRQRGDTSGIAQINRLREFYY